jgi:predicted CXXCH cytochrome family protein
MPRRIPWIISILGGLLAGGTALWWIFHADEEPVGASRQSGAHNVMEELGPAVKPPPLGTEYVGSQACRECHREYWDKYQSHPMSHTMFHAAATSPVEDFEHRTTFTAGRSEYRVEREGQTVRHHEIAIDLEGETIYDQAVEVQYAVGSGKRGRSYFVDRGGLLFMSPISWYAAEGQGRWDLSPSYNPAGHLRFERRIVDACVSCHVGVAHPRAGEPDCFDSPPFSELSIGCERCHGPGGKHVAWQRSDKPDRGTDPIVNPAELEPQRRDAVCYQCHLLGQERVLQYGRNDFDFRPGMYLSDVWAVLVEGTGVTAEGATEAVSQTEQMLASRCYQRSAGKLGCTSCHDPHSSPAPEVRREFYRNRCLACHADRGCQETLETRQQADLDSCIVCHFPRLNASDVPHTSQTDHRVLRRPAAPNSPAPVAVTPDSIQIFEMGTPALPQRAERRAKALLQSEYAERQHDQRLAARVEPVLEQFAKAAPDDVAVLTALAQVAAVQQHSADVAFRWNAVLAVAPRNERALEALAAVSIATRRPADAVEYLERYLQVNPWDAGLHGQRSRLLAQLGREAEALAEAKQAVELDPSRLENYEWLAKLCSGMNLPDESRRYEELLRRVGRKRPM